MVFTEKNNLKQENIIVLVSPWKSPSFFYYFIKKVIPSKYGHIHYVYPKKTLNSDPDSTKKNFLKVIEKITQDLKKLNRIKSRNFFLYGQSLGGLFCMIVADKIDVKKVMLVAPGANLAESFWYGEKTKELRQEMEKRGVSIEKLKKCWQKISPDNYFGGKTRHAIFYIILSSKDKTIPINNGRKLVEILKRQHIKFNVQETSLSHVAICIKESLLTKNFCRSLIKKS
jgi:esterase/lipase